MQINKNSWHYKIWESTFDRYDPAPSGTDLCRYCHRVFWRLTLWAFLITVGLFAAGMICYGLLYKGLYQNTLFTLIALAVLGAIGGVVYLYIRWLNGGKELSEPTSLAGKYLVASKQKVCPMVDFKE
jgi:hypothetical protein